MRITFRSVEVADREFLFGVYASTREEEMAAAPWGDAEKAGFLRMQFDARDAHYRQQHAGARFEVILLDGEPSGQLCVERDQDAIRVIDIALLTAYRGAGIGARILGDLQEEAAAAGKPVRLHVLDGSPALRFYERLGFRRTRHTGVHTLMEWVAH